MKEYIFAYIDVDTYKKLKYDCRIPNFLPVSDYPIVDIALKNEIGMVGPVRLIYKKNLTPGTPE